MHAAIIVRDHYHLQSADISLSVVSSASSSSVLTRV